MLVLKLGVVPVLKVGLIPVLKEGVVAVNGLNVVEEFWGYWGLLKLMLNLGVALFSWDGCEGGLMLNLIWGVVAMGWPVLFPPWVFWEVKLVLNWKFIFKFELLHAPNK